MFEEMCKSIGWASDWDFSAEVCQEGDIPQDDDLRSPPSTSEAPAAMAGAARGTEAAARHHVDPQQELKVRVVFEKGLGEF